MEVNVVKKSHSMKCVHMLDSGVGQQEGVPPVTQPTPPL